MTFFTAIFMTMLGSANLAVSPWDGSWKLDPARSSPVAKEGAAEGYRFSLRGDGRIRWEIPSLDEVVEGRTDGRPMRIRRPNGPAGMTLSVTREGSRVLLYRVARNGRPLGQGRMTLVDDGTAWVDIVWGAGHPETAHSIVYVRQ